MALDTTGISAAFVKGYEIFGKKVLSWDLRADGVQIRTNVKAPQALTKLSVDGEPRPYRKQDDFNGQTVEDRILTAYQSKYDFDIDPEDLRNKYLADLPDTTFEQYVIDQAAKQFLDKIQSNTVYLGVRNAAGAAAADICDGFGTILANAITALKVTPVATGAITNANAVTQVEMVADATPVWMKKQGFMIHCSWDVLAKYRKHYRTLNGFSFDPNEIGQYKLDGYNAILHPCAFMGTSQRLIATVDGNLVFGTDIDNITTVATPHLNILQCRILMPAGCQIADLAAIVVNDQA